MIIVISPAKTIVSNLPCSTDHYSEPYFKSEANTLIARLRSLSTSDLEEIMNLSPKLALLNFERIQGWNSSGIKSKPAIAMFKGEVFNGLKGWEFNEKDLLYAQDHLLILSGLFGLLRPLDKIKPYRLEMGTEMDFGSLYEFWGDKITNKLNGYLGKDGGPLINLASKEYFKALNPTKLKYPVVTPEFKELKDGRFKMISVYAKKARGLMSRFILDNKIEKPEHIKAFNTEGYYYNAPLSSPLNPVFTRDLS